MDRTIRGLIAGISASAVMEIWNLTDYYLIHITKLRFLDWAAVLLTWDLPKTGFLVVFSLMIHILWNGFLGIIFVNLSISRNSKSLSIKSTIYSMMLWFIFKVIVNLFRVPFLSGSQPIPGAMSNVIAVILWGLALGLILEKLNKSTKGKEIDD